MENRVELKTMEQYTGKEEYSKKKIHTALYEMILFPKILLQITHSFA